MTNIKCGPNYVVPHARAEQLAAPISQTCAVPSYKPVPPHTQCEVLFIQCHYRGVFCPVLTCPSFQVPFLPLSNLIWFIPVLLTPVSCVRVGLTPLAINSFRP